MKILLAIICFFNGFNAYAKSNWQFIVENEDSWAYFIDRNSIQKSGDSVTFWYRNNKPHRDEFGNLSYKTQITINCRTRENITRFLMAYDDLNANGKLTASFAAPNPTWRPVAPDTVNWIFMTTVCNK